MCLFYWPNSAVRLEFSILSKKYPFARFLAAFVAMPIVAFAQLSTPSSSPATQAISSQAISSGNSIYADAKPRLIQIRSLIKSTGNQSSIGSGFFVTADGLALTNYHVISQVALEPDTYRLEFEGADGQRGSLELVAFDVNNDLAAVRLQPADVSSGKFTKINPFKISSRAQSAKSDAGLQKGERLFAMGNPLDLGFTIVEGTYNSLVTKVYGDRIHFSGALNAGMSGGPTVDSRGEVVGVNVAKRLDGELVSFLVPARFAAQLLQKAQDAEPMDPKSALQSIGIQLTERQAIFAKDFQSAPRQSSRLGGFEVTELNVPWLSCWSRSNAEAEPKPKFFAAANSCNAGSDVYLANNWMTGAFRYAHRLVINESLNSRQIHHTLNEGMRLSGGATRRFTAVRCDQKFVAIDSKLAQRVTLCSRAYRQLDSIYDFSIHLTSQFGSEQSLISEMRLSGVGWDNGIKILDKFVRSVQFTGKTP